MPLFVPVTKCNARLVQHRNSPSTEWYIRKTPIYKTSIYQTSFFLNMLFTKLPVYKTFFYIRVTSFSKTFHLLEVPDPIAHFMEG
jgi:hypothetical protein